MTHGITGRVTGRKPRRSRNQEAFEKALEALTPEGSLRLELVEARMRAGLSQAELARRMGTLQPAIARLESGCALPSFTTLRKLAEATGSRLVVRLDEPPTRVE